MSLLIDPVVGQPHLAMDLVQHFVANVLNADNSPVFVNGVADNNNTDPTLIYLLPYYLEEKPDNCAVIRVTDKDPNGENPVRRASVTVVFRMPLSADQTVSAQSRSSAAAEALVQWLRPNGVVRTHQTLPSGRLARIFSRVLNTPLGEDNSRRFTTNVTFDLLYLDINVP